MKNPKTSFRVESHNGRLYLHGQNVARFLSRGRRMPSFQLFACSSSQIPERRGLSDRSVDYAGAGCAVQSVCTILCVQSYCTEYFDSIPGSLSFDTAFCCLKYLLLLTKFFSSIRQTANRLLRFIFFFLTVLHEATSFFLSRHFAFVFSHFQFLLLIFHNGTFK